MARLVCRKPIHATEHYINFSHFKSHHLETQRSVVQTLLFTNQAQVFQIVWAGKCTSVGFHDKKFSWLHNESFVGSRLMDISELKQRWRWPRRQREGEKSRRFRLVKQELCACITLFCTFLCRPCTTTTWKCLILRFVEDVKFFVFLNFDTEFCNSTSGKFANIWWIERDWTSAIKFEAARIRFLSDVFVVVAVVVV